MKRLEKLKLTEFRKKELEQREMKALKGGSSCGACGCGFDTWSYGSSVQQEFGYK